MAKPYERKTRFYWNPRRPYERLISLKTPIRPDQTEQYFDKNLLWEIIMGRAKYFYSPDYEDVDIVWDKIFDNKAIKSHITDLTIHLVGREQDTPNKYTVGITTPRTTSDFVLWKRVAGTWTLLGYEAIDLIGRTTHLVKLSISDTTLNAYREDMVTPKITVTDTAFTSGYWGIRGWSSDYPTVTSLLLSAGEVILEAPSSLNLQPIRYYECPIIGDSSFDNPFRPQLPEEIANHPRFGKINRLAFTQSCIIKTDRKTGKPVEYIALVQIFRTRPRYCHSLSKSLEALEAISGVKRLRKDIFERRKKKLLES